MSDLKKRVPEVITLSSEIVYLPCKFCGSSDYDLADGDVDDDGNYEPNGCDICGFRMTEIKTDSLSMH